MDSRHGLTEAEDVCSNAVGGNVQVELAVVLLKTRIGKDLPEDPATRSFS